MSKKNRKKKINRGTLNYIVDIVIGAGFIVSMASGIIFLFLPQGGGFQGGRNIYFQAEVLGMSRWFLKDLHTYSSILMGIGVLGHLILHWNWIVCMTRNLFHRGKKQSSREACEVTPQAAE
ncbi:MAG: DUF4405 domain-containing protein [Spirochaetota bacterium]|nr:DUF4405 domain-containing protein [Spirochaetota bacterium]